MDSPPMRESSLKDNRNKETDMVKENQLPDTRTSDIPKFSKIQRHMLQRTKSLPPAKAKADMNPSTFGTKNKSFSEEFRLTQQNSETQQTSSHILHMKMTTASPESEARGRSVTLKSEPALDNHSSFNSKSLSQSPRVSGEKEDLAKADWSLELDASDGSSESEMSIDGLVEHLLHSSRQRSYASKEGKKDIGAGEDFDEDAIDWLDLTKDFESNLEVWECEICLGSASTMTLCCQFHICDQCMSSYINHKVSEARIQMECPNYNCHVLLPRALIEVSLTPELRINYQKFLADRNEDPYSKTCPGCNAIHSVQPEELERPKRKMHNGLQVCCTQCQLVWCFLCQAPYHNGITCKEYRKGDVMLRKWAKEWSYGQFNAQRCPKCKVYIQKANGCDHVICTQCVTAFCYRCGKRYINTRIFGSHMSRYSVFGCKYRLLPKRPALRRLIRGSCFAALLSGGIILAGLGVVLGAGLLGASVFFLPGYGIFRWRRRVKLKRRHKRFVLRQLREKEARQRWQEELLSKMTGREAALCPLWEAERDNLSVEFLDSLEQEREGQKGLDTQQVHVIVHRSMNANQAEGSSKIADEGACSLSLSEEREDGGFFINKYTTDSSEMMVLMPGDSTDKDGGSDSVITVTDFKEIPGTGGYTTLVANIVSRPVTNAKSDSHKSEEGTKASRAGKGAGKASALSRVKKNKSAEKVEKSGTGVSKENHLEKDRAGTDENEKARVEGQPSDASLSPCENPCKPNQVGAEESCPAASCKVSSPVLSETVQNVERGSEGGGKAEASPAISLATGTGAKDVKADGCGYNRCFGNIFSKRGQGQQGSDGSEFKAKKQHEAVTVTAQKKKSAGWKSSTWEKTRRALSFTNEGSKDVWETREDKMSSLATYFCAAEKATGLPQLEGSKLNNESLPRPELDRSQSGHPRLNIKALEDLFLARSKIFSRKWYPDEEKKIKLQKGLFQDRGGLKDATTVQSDASDHASSNTGDQKEKETPGEEMQGPVLTSKVRRRSMVEMGALSFSADGNEALGSGRSYSNISLDWDTLPDPLDSQPGSECNTIISPSSVTSRL